MITDLKAEDFALSEDGQQRQIISVSLADVPVCIGLLVDRSGSMRHKQATVAAVLSDFVRAGNPDNQTFVVNFNDDSYLDQDFTRSFQLIEEALHRDDARGGTALYDAASASADHLAKARDCQKRVIVVVTDGKDNASEKTLQQTIQSILDSGNPIIYAIGLPDDSEPSQNAAARRALEALSAATGGVSFFIGNIKDMSKITPKIAEEIRHQYTITYVPNSAAADGILPRLKVEVHAPGRKDLVVRMNAGMKKASQPAAQADHPVTQRDSPVAQAATQPSFKSCIGGSVVDQEEKPVQGMRVEFWPTVETKPFPREGYPWTTSNDRGQFKIGSLAPGSYRLYTRNERSGYPSTRYPLYQDHEPPVITPSEACADVVINVGRRAARLRINVVDASTQAPIPVSTVSLRSTSGKNYNYTRNDKNERTREVLVPANAEISIEVWSPPGYSRSKPVTVQTPDPETSQELTVALEPRGNPSLTSAPNH